MRNLFSSLPISPFTLHPSNFTRGAGGEGLSLLASADGTLPSTLYCVGEPVELTAAADDGTSLPKFKGTAYTGGKMRPMGFYRDVYVDLAGAKVASGSRPIHRDHSPSKIVGHSESITNDGRKITVAGLISGTGPDAAEVRDNAKNKFPWRLSIGASIEVLNYIEEGEKFECNGKTHTAPKGGCYVVRACTIYEISFVSLAGDDNTSATVSATQGSVAMKFGDWLASRGHDINDLTASKLAELRSEFEAETKPGKDQPVGAGPGTPTAPGSVTAGRGDDTPPATPPVVTAGQADDVDPITERRASLAAEMERAEEIDAICAKYSNPKIKVGEAEVSLRAHATREGWTADKTELEAMRASRPTGGPGIHVVDRQASSGVIEASLCMSAGLKETDVAEDYDDKTMEAAMSRQHRGMGLQQLICGFILAHGGHATPGRFDDDTIRSAFEIQRDLRASGTGSSTYSLPGILSNVANKAMRAAYKAVPDVLSKIAFYRPVNDFKTTYSYTLTSTGKFQKLGVDGELKHSGLVESEYANRAETRGQVVMLTRIHMRNDDLGAFLRVPTMIARNGATEVQSVGFTLLETAPTAFATVGNKNYIEGSTKDLSIDTLTELSTLMQEQVDKDNKPIAVTPKILVTAVKNQVLARQIYDETKIVTGSTGKNLASNPHAGMFQPEHSPFITANKDAVYLFADPLDVAALEMVFLDGRTVPIIEFGDLDFTHLGAAYRGYFDFGGAFADHRGLAMSKGKA